MRRQWWLMDERAADPEQFDEAIIYTVSTSLEEAKEDQVEAGCGVIIEVEVDGGGPNAGAEWVQLCR